MVCGATSLRSWAGGMHTLLFPGDSSIREPFCPRRLAEVITDSVPFLSGLIFLLEDVYVG